MHRPPPWSCSLFIALAAWSSCTGGGPGPNDGGGGRGDGGDAGAREVIKLFGSVYEAKLETERRFIAGARVCILDHPEIACATTDWQGEYTMTFPAFASSTLFLMHFTAAGHLGTVRPANYTSTPEFVSTSWPSGVPLRADDEAKEMATKAGFTYPAQGTGFIELQLVGRLASEIIEGVTATLTPSTGTGPIYASASGDPEPSLTQTVASNFIRFGNVAPGPVTITVNPGARTCNTPEKISGAWPASGANTLPLVVAAGSVTQDAYLFCR
jgi:hypothetical protein